MKKLLTFLFIYMFVFTRAQDTTYSTLHQEAIGFGNGNEITTGGNNSLVIEKRFYESGELLGLYYYKNKELNGKCTTYYKSGKLKSCVNYLNNSVNGQCITYWENGKLKRDDIFYNGAFVSGKCYGHKGQDTAHYDYWKYPEFPGGSAKMAQYILKNLTYTSISTENYVAGKVFIKFIVEKDGSLSNITVMKGVNKELNAEAIRVLKNMPKWTPAMLDGEPIKSYFNIPIMFKAR